MDFTSEQKEKAKACKTLDEFKQLAKAEGLTLSDEQAEQYFKGTRAGELSDDDLDSVAGGKGSSTETRKERYECPWCNRTVELTYTATKKDGNITSSDYSPRTCKCGAVLEYYDSAHSLVFNKIGVGGMFGVKRD